MDAIEIVSSHVIDDANDVLSATFHLTQNGDFFVEEFSSGRTFLIKLTNLIGAACTAIQFMDKHANNAHIARFYAENFHTDEAEMIAALKMIERGELYPALDKYGEDQVTPMLAFGRTLIDGIGVPDTADTTLEDLQFGRLVGCRGAYKWPAVYWNTARPVNFAANHLSSRERLCRRRRIERSHDRDP
jgi:hypothetical protein